MGYRILFLLLTFITFQTYAQQKYPKNYFGKPMDLPLILAGNFGELRNNHFHSGLDIKTRGEQGYAVNSVADGYVSRIRIQAWGLGKAIYVTHPNGFTSVYGHLKKFTPKIEAYLKKQQYNQKSYEVELFLRKDELVVSKNQPIAFSGDTGSSGGPHLHFELRSTQTEETINPLLFGYDVPDHIKPIISKLVAYPLNDTSQINQSNLPVAVHFKTLPDGNYLANNITAYGLIGFGISTSDRQDAAFNKNGNYDLSLTKNDTLTFHHSINRFAFPETKYINLLLDFDAFIKRKETVQKCFIEPKNKLKIYDQSLGSGKLTIKDGESYDIKIKSKDFQDNTAQIIIPIKGKKDTILNKNPIFTSPYFINNKLYNKFEIENISVEFSENTFYKDFYLDFKVKNNTAFIDKNKQPLDRNFTITFKVDTLNYPDISKYYVANFINNNYATYIPTVIRGNKISASLRFLGTYGLKKDTSNPTIKPINFKDGQWLTNYHFLKFAISDSGTGIKSYNAFIDDEWILMEYEPKKNELTFDFSDKNFETTKHVFKLIVTDNVGNTSVYSANFSRKNN